MFLATTSQLIQFTRKFRISDQNLVTPTEFRYLLLKFGVALPQEQVDIIFNKFDSDRSGTIDVNEFGDYIINSDFKIKDVKQKKAINGMKTNYPLEDTTPLPLVVRKKSIRPANLEADPELEHGTSVQVINSRFKQAMKQNQGYMLLKKALKPFSLLNKGFVETPTLHTLINSHCVPLSMNDFRLILSLHRLDASNRVDIEFFLDMYNPFAAAQAALAVQSKKKLYKTVSVGQFVGF